MCQYAGMHEIPRIFAGMHEIPRPVFWSHPFFSYNILSKSNFLFPAGELLLIPEDETAGHFCKALPDTQG